jgi:hydrogenase nickel incorporation protein HypA/HybF
VVYYFFKNMHELGITENIVTIATQHAQGHKIKRITLEIGKLSAIMPDAIEFCFDVCSRETLLEDAILEIIEIPGRGQCRKCGNKIALDEPFGICECGSIELDLIAGQELKIKEMEIE